MSDDEMHEGCSIAGRGKPNMSAVEPDATLREQLTEVARACRILEMEGHGDMTLGHLSLREDADGLPLPLYG